MECTILSAEKWSCQISLRTGKGTSDKLYSPVLGPKDDVELWIRRAQATVLCPHLPDDTFKGMGREDIKANTDPGRDPSVLTCHELRLRCAVKGIVGICRLSKLRAHWSVVLGDGFNKLRVRVVQHNGAQACQDVRDLPARHFSERFKDRGQQRVAQDRDVPERRVKRLPEPRDMR